MTADCLLRYNHRRPYEALGHIPGSSIVSSCSPTSTSDWCRNSRGLQSQLTAFFMLKTACNAYL